MAIETRQRVADNPPQNKMELLARTRSIRFPRRPLVMGIVNINNDSFSGDGKIDTGWALERAAELTRAGADIIDAGGESARTNRPAIDCAEEIRRVLPFVEGFAAAVRDTKPRDDQQIWPPLLSVNTWRPEVAEEVLPKGGDLLNDMSGLPDAANAAICARHSAALLIMHSQGQPKVPHNHVTYGDVMEEMRAFFRDKIRLATEAGLPRESIMLDPGIDFAKQAPDNLRIYRELELLTEFDRPILLPVSRKSVIGKTLGITEPSERDAGTVACIVAGMLRGANIFRVHNVNAAWQAIKTIASLPDSTASSRPC